MRRVIVDKKKKLPCRAFSITSREHDRSKDPSQRSYAFVEFRSRRDAEDAYYDMYDFSLFIFEENGLKFYLLGMEDTLKDPV